MADGGQQDIQQNQAQGEAWRRAAENLSEGLYSAVSAGDVVGLRQLLAEGANADQFYEDDQNISSKSILHVACGKGQTECVKLLLEWGSMPNIRDKWGQSPLHYSICAQFLDTASILLEHMDASAVEIINDKDRYGKTPLHSAADSANVEAIEILLKHGADVNIRNFDGITPLMVCAETCGRSKSVRALEVLIDGGALINLVDYRSKRSALQRAAVAKNVAAVEFLLSMGADIDSLDNTYRTALTNVMWDHVRNREGMCNIDPDVMTIIILLTQAGANLDLAMSEYCNPLVTAAFLQAPVLVRFFLDQGAQPNVNFMSGVTPLLVSTSKKDVDAVKIFLTYNCDMTIKGRVRRRRVDFIFDPMEMALEDKNYHLVQMFLAAGYPSNFIRQQLEERLKSDPNGQSSGLDPDLSQWLLKRISCPSTLRELTVYRLRHILGQSLLKLVPKLPLPSRIQDSILLTDILT
ncbi:hypothetical protein BaRGS_00019459 [Batillaria attramentaria]|uniref:SOCS box domain-containing protein n=1 Tax=Batillaria attramentaria TaxID=370345 RepID=A0ABD0KQX9_9CAEN